MAIYHSDRGFDVQPKSKSQEDFARSLDNNTVVFATGPAGTGKTYVALALALSALKNDDTDEILLSRPAVQAGNELGFLPGDLDEKLDPYMAPFKNILDDLLKQTTQHNLEEAHNSGIRYQALGFLRGQTINECWAVLDEAQNATRSELEMFLTRLGPDAKAIITGDPKQTDLENPRNSALYDAEGLLSTVNDITFVEFGEDEIVRNDVVKGVIKAYRNAAAADADRRRRRQNSDGNADGVEW